MKYLRKKKTMALWKVILIDLLLLGVILVIFALFHHVLPKMISEYQWQQAMLNATEPIQTDPPETAAPNTESTQPLETEVPTEPDNRTEWQKKFEEHFTEDVVIGDNSYTSQEISITIDTVSETVEGRKLTYYVADVYIASLDNFKTYTAYGDIIYYGMQDAIGMSKDVNAVFAVNGDYITVQKNGFLVRNGEVFVSDQNNSICVLYPDGSMEAYDRGSYNINDILEKEPQQVWSFGPKLLDDNGKAIEKFELASGINGRHPRCAIGYYEPGHYCFIVVDGRQSDYSAGIEVADLAKIFEELGCKVAYNLDGGRSAVMMFQHEFYNRPFADGRELGDILYIAESGKYTETTTTETQAQEEAE